MMYHISVLHSFKWLDDISVWIYHILYICLLVDGHFGCVCFLVIMNNVSVDICVQVFVYTYVLISLGYIPSGRIVGSMITLYLTFGGSVADQRLNVRAETIKLLEENLCIKLHHFIFSSAVYEGYNLFTSLTVLLIICPFDSSHPSRCEVVFPCGFDLYFPDG